MNRLADWFRATAKRVWLPLLTLFVGIAIGWMARHESVSLVSLAPNDELRVCLVERSAFIDRNFDVRLERLTDRESSKPETLLFRSPDEGRPIGSERIVWSPDSRQFVLLGRRFFVRDAVKLSNGEILYLMYDVPSGKLWCNSHQQAEHPGFDLADVPWLAID